MTLTPQLAQQCLEALVSCLSLLECYETDKVNGEPQCMLEARESIAALREALASGEGDEARDAARYRWLRDGELVAQYPYPVMRQGGHGTVDYTIWGEDLDAAIDAAMKGNGK